jgi:hypothetical protein
MIATKRREILTYNRDTNLNSKSTATLASTPIKTCAHHWVIETTRRKTSKGYCIYCGKTKVFNNRPVDITQVSQFERRLYHYNLTAFDKILKCNCYDLLGDSR